ncbi:MAG: tRNA pseudouridine(54/55) synthase Pus10 [Promethearchaeia archaeon]|nr:MAG: tRNA pseudouridine(54/55) synthase Pus10 [Candidatus Lokiarchaeia archaeon]
MDENSRVTQEKSPENEIEELKIIIEPQSLEILLKTYKVLQKYKLCQECLGRQFSYLATGTDNSTRAQAILLTLTMEAHAALKKESLEYHTTLFGDRPLEILELIAIQSHFQPAFHVLLNYYSNTNQNEKKEYISPLFDSHNCDLCLNLLMPTNIKRICEEIEQETSNYDFENFLVGTYLNPKITNKEEDIRAQYGLISGESFKANLNRLVGKKLQQIFHKPTQYKQPDLQIMIDLRESMDPTYELHPKSLFLESKYKKFVRNLPQTHWHCHDCRGRGIDRRTNEICQTCHGSGDMYPSSVEDLIASVVLPYTRGKSAVLHGAGREDIDARCLGAGRPFVLEIKAPQKRILPLNKIMDEINQKFSKSIRVGPFSVVNKQKVINYKSDSEITEKSYHALVYLAQPISESFFAPRMELLRSQLMNHLVKQRTPLRVVHRRADRTRSKEIFEIQGKWIDARHIFFKIRAQGGTYIKELISSDNGRTVPSIAKIFGIPMLCVELDIVNVREIKNS